MTFMLGLVAMIFLPPLLLLLIYALGKRRWIWLAIPVPIAILVAVACFWGALADYGSETRMIVLLWLIPYTVAVSVVTAIAAAIRKKRQDRNDKKAVAIAAVVLCVAALGLSSHIVLSNTSDGYLRIYDRRVFSQLRGIRPEDVASIEVFDIRKKWGEPAPIVYSGDMAFFADLEYASSNLGGYVGEFGCPVNIRLKDGGCVYFTRWKGSTPDEFQVEYKSRIFFVKSPQLWADISNEPQIGVSP